MKNPKIEDYFLPILHYLADKPAQTRGDIIKAAASKLQLDEEVRAERVSKKAELTYASRIGWALTYLRKAGMVQTPSWGRWEITPLGKEIEANPPFTFDLAYLKKYPLIK